MTVKNRAARERQMKEDRFFYYKDNRLKVEEIDVEKIINEVGTPAYIYSSGSFKNQLSQLESAFQAVPHLVCYSLKVCHNIHVVRLFVDQGCGLDIVSGGELYRALKAGVDPKKIVYSGVAKTEEEIQEAAHAGLLMLNVESEQELERINKIGRLLKKRVPIAIRVNPNINAKTHPYITTGMKKNKFGIDHEFVLSVYQKARTMTNVEILGVDCHIGSQLLDVKPFRDALEIIAGYVRQFRKQGIAIKYVDVGGGLGIPYKEGDPTVSTEEYAKAITGPFLDIPDIMFVLEPGRFLAAQGGILVTSVQYIKENSAKKRFVIVDTGMHHLMRPPLYDGFHAIVPVERRTDRKVKVDVVGPICESTDFLAKDRPLEEVAQGDLLAIKNVGAYCVVLSSHYNSHLMPVEVLVDRSDFRVIRRRETYDEMLALEMR